MFSSWQCTSYTSSALISISLFLTFFLPPENLQLLMKYQMKKEKHQLMFTKIPFELQYHLQFICIQIVCKCLGSKSSVSYQGTWFQSLIKELGCRCLKISCFDHLLLLWNILLTLITNVSLLQHGKIFYKTQNFCSNS